MKMCFPHPLEKRYRSGYRQHNTAVVEEFQLRDGERPFYTLQLNMIMHSSSANNSMQRTQLRVAADAGR